MTTLDGKVVVVTGGAGRGLGYAMVKLFNAAGARVVSCDVDQASLDRIAAELPDVTAVHADVGREADRARLFEAVGDVVDVLCNNAAAIDRVCAPHEASPDEWQRVLDVNVTAPFLLSRHVLPGMLRRGSGVIINTGSIAGLRGGRAGPAYTASKHALVGLTQNIASAYGELGIRCNAICPGPMGPPEEAGTKSGAEIAGLSPGGVAMLTRDAGKPGRADAHLIAELALFLAGPAATSINGAIIPVDAGWAAY